MSIEQNKQTVLRWIGYVNQGDEAAILSLLTDDFRFKAMARAPVWLKHDWGGKEFAASPKALSTLLETPVILNVVGMVGEGDIVTVEANTDAWLKNGKHYDNAYHFVFSFRDGTISEVREYCCTYLVEECFGGFNPNNPAAKPAPV